MSTISIASADQFQSLLGSTSVVVTDFYADWCGPCKQIAPVFEQLASKHSKAKVVAFAKVNVDNQQQVAQRYGVSAMPTFIIFKNGSAAKTIRGADPRGLAHAIEDVVKGAGGAAKAASFSTAGRTLGGGPQPKGRSLQRPTDYQALIDVVVNLFGLYLVSLFSFDAYGAAETSRFNVYADKERSQRGPAAAKRTGVATQVGKKLGTIADFSGDGK